MRRPSFPMLAGIAALLTAAAACQQDAAPEATDTAVVDSAAPAAAAGAPAAAPAPGTFLDPNTATEQELQAAGVPAPAAAAVVAGRPYPDNLALDRVLTEQQLTETQKDSVVARVWTPIDPTTASNAEIQLIPGVGERMAHEFEEYRPWTSADHFRREIGKYGDDTEVTRLLGYTTLK